MNRPTRVNFSSGSRGADLSVCIVRKRNSRNSLPSLPTNCGVYWTVPDESNFFRLATTNIAGPAAARQSTANIKSNKRLTTGSLLLILLNIQLTLNAVKQQPNDQREPQRRVSKTTILNKSTIKTKSHDTTECRRHCRLHVWLDGLAAYFGNSASSKSSKRSDNSALSPASQVKMLKVRDLLKLLNPN